MSGRRARLQTVHLDYGAILVPSFSPVEGELLPREISNSAEVVTSCSCSAHHQVTVLPLEPDPYESETVQVRLSSVPGAEEGLFARRPLPPETVLAFYNGVRYVAVMERQCHLLPILCTSSYISCMVGFHDIS